MPDKPGGVLPASGPGPHSENSHPSLRSGNGATAPTPPTLDELLDTLRCAVRRADFAANSFAPAFNDPKRENDVTALRWLAGSLSETMADTRRLDFLQAHCDGIEWHSEDSVSLAWFGEEITRTSGGTIREAIDAGISASAPPEPSA